MLRFLTARSIGHYYYSNLVGTPPRGEKKKVKLIKILSLTAVAVFAAMAFVGVTSASASDSLLCTNDTTGLNPTAAECNEPSTIHFLTVSVTLNAKGEEITADTKGTLLNGVLNVKCEALLSGEVLKGLVTAGPVVVHVPAASLVYSNCTFGCTVTVLSGGLLKVLMKAAELSEVTGEGFMVRVDCFGFFDCDYDASGLIGHGLGPLEADTGKKGHVTYSENLVNLLENLSGGCPATAKLDALFQSLTPLYVRG